MELRIILAALAVMALVVAAAFQQANARPGGLHYEDFAPRHCGALIRSAGKKNLVRIFARNSAVFAWKREARYVYGHDYGYWNEARAPRIQCHSEGIFVRCVAKAHPCER